MPEEIAWKLLELGRVIDPPKTAALYAPLQEKEPYQGVKIERDVKYGPADRNLLDVFMPEPALSSPRPVLIFVHGGAFVGGNKRTAPDSPFYDNIMLWAAKNGFVGVNVTYRLAPQAPWPAGAEESRGSIGSSLLGFGDFGADAVEKRPVLFQRRAHRHITGLQFAAAGVNAHVNFDLAVAVADTCTQLGSAPDRGAQHQSYQEINAIFAEEMQSIREHFESLWERLIDRIVLGRVVNKIDDWIVVGARDIAWENAEVLWNIRQRAGDETGFIAQLASK